MCYLVVIRQNCNFLSTYVYILTNLLLFNTKKCKEHFLKWMQYWGVFLGKGKPCTELLKGQRRSGCQTHFLQWPNSIHDAC